MRGRPEEFDVVRNPPNKIVFPSGIWMSCLIGCDSNTSGARAPVGGGPLRTSTRVEEESATLRLGKGFGVTSKVMPTSKYGRTSAKLFSTGAVTRVSTRNLKAFPGVP